MDAATRVLHILDASSRKARAKIVGTPSSCSASIFPDVPHHLCGARAGRPAAVLSMISGDRDTALTLTRASSTTRKPLCIQPRLPMSLQNILGLYKVPPQSDAIAHKRQPEGECEPGSVTSMSYGSRRRLYRKAECSSHWSLKRSAQVAGRQDLLFAVHSPSVRQMGPLPSCFVAPEEKKCYCRSWWLGSHRAECAPPSPFPSLHPTFGDNAASAVSDPTDVGCFRRPKSVGRPLGLIAIALCCCRVAFCCFYKAGDGSYRLRELKWMGPRQRQWSTGDRGSAHLESQTTRLWGFQWKRERDCFSRKYAQTHRQRASRGDRWTEGRKEGGEQTREQASDHEAEPHCVARRRRFLLLTNDDGPCADADSEREATTFVRH